jgi:hypothetical protein
VYRSGPSTSSGFKGLDLEKRFSFSKRKKCGIKSIDRQLNSHLIGELYLRRDFNKHSWLYHGAKLRSLIPI